MTFARKIGQRRELGYRHPMLKVRDVVTDHDCVGAERSQEKEEGSTAHSPHPFVGNAHCR